MPPVAVSCRHGREKLDGCRRAGSRRSEAGSSSFRVSTSSPHPATFSSSMTKTRAFRAADQTTEERAEKLVYFEVFGCQMNKLDAELMLATLSDHGYGLTEDIQRAGVILYNTCA